MGIAALAGFLLLLGVDRFKDVNDTLGHHHGDQLLCEAGRRLQGALRHVDTVARLGGDEFAVLVSGATTEGAAAVAEKLRTALQKPLTLDGVMLDLEASIGIAVYWPHPDHGLLGPGEFIPWPSGRTSSRSTAPSSARW